MPDAEWLSDVYSTVDEACIGEGALPPGVIGKLARLMDTARMSPDSRDYITKGDDILLTMHRLRSELKNRSEVKFLRAKLRTMRDDWIASLTIC